VASPFNLLQNMQNMHKGIVNDRLAFTEPPSRHAIMSPSASTRGYNQRHRWTTATLTDEKRGVRSSLLKFAKDWCYTIRWVKSWRSSIGCNTGSCFDLRCCLWLRANCAVETCLVNQCQIHVRM
jgi:hypothetical protein